MIYQSNRSRPFITWEDEWESGMDGRREGRREGGRRESGTRHLADHGEADAVLD
jgi:hypothetical protein